MSKPDGQPLRALLVEDNDGDALLVERALSDGGFTVTARRVEREAGMRAALGEGGWDVVLSDYNLPGFSARAALSLTREADADIPFIVVSGAIGEQNVVALMQQGVSDFVMKDKLARLAPVVGHALEAARLRREHRQAQMYLRESEKLLRGVTVSLGEGLIVQNSRREMVMMNPEAERLLGWAEGELLDRDALNLIYWQGLDGVPEVDFSGELFSVLRGSICRKNEDVFVRRDGSRMPVSIVASPILEQDQVIAVVLAFQDISQRKQIEHDLIMSREQLRELSAHLQTVREEERAHLSRELHDGLGQMLAVIKLDAKWFTERRAADDDLAQRRGEGMIALLDRTVDTMRRMASDLRPVMLDDLGLLAAVEWLAEEVAEHSGLDIRMTLDMHGGEELLSGEAKTALYRITQECLTNVVRHAQATQVLISLGCANDTVILVVSDNGHGMISTESAKSGSYGLLGMRERAYALGGRLEINALPGDGVSVEVEIPLSSGRDTPKTNRRQ